MTEYWFGGDLASVAIRATPGAVVTAWNAQVGGSQHTELADGDGMIVDHVVVSDGTAGYSVGTIPRFKAPTLAVWLSIDGGPRTLVVSTDLPAVLDSVRLVAVEAQNAAVAAAAAAAELAESSSIAGHVGDADPHPQYHNDARGDARYVRSAPGPMQPPAAPLELVDITSNPAPAAANLYELWVTHNGVRRLLASVNGHGYHRVTSHPGAFYEDLWVANTAWLSTGRAFAVNHVPALGAPARLLGIDALGRLITSGQPWVDVTAVDPAATGRYTEDVTAGVAPLAVRWDADDVMRLRGRVAVAAGGTVAGDVLLVLPGGYRTASARLRAPVVLEGFACPVEVMPTGEVVARATLAGPLTLSVDDLTVSV